MPFVIYVFTISAFALGLAEFVPIGLTDVMAQGLCVGVEQTGAAVTTYALGATFVAPVLSALTASWSRKNVMLTTAVVFTAGSLAAAFAATLPQLLLARFIAGLGHGLFLAAASSTAARLAGPGKAGRAVAVVFGGFTLAMAIGVPLSTWLGGVVSWRPVLGAIAAFGAFGFLGLLFGMKDPVRSVPGEHSDSAMQNIGMLFNRKLLAGALVTVLAYAGSFTDYTFIAPILTQVTGVTGATVSLFMLVYGITAAVGNILGGKLTDSMGVNRANILIISGIVVVVLGMWLLSSSPVSMGILVALLGMVTFAAVPALQARLIGVAEQHAPHAHGVAAGLNIAGFNSGIALGSVLGSITISHAGIVYTGISGAIVSLLGLLLLLAQIRRSHSRKFQQVKIVGQ
ncbi:TPA: MFS transporter [Escherichia coli]|uniref:MFS transporter n=1 Tax=Escherichia coli TaxID=562 RepID=UPI001894A307|nr:MFS transporter [Escherichia coli]HAN5071820.1 MFS transporter [Escherichia coli]HAN5095429.1 MFS transporter [Escherichia coli]HAP2673506.1 MFS transporter [Escherichia coli]HCK6964067.1 MFS transporter [Escherichia coli]HCK6971690.1 MFS transporter [Escherichia coli]